MKRVPIEIFVLKNGRNSLIYKCKKKTNCKVIVEFTINYLCMWNTSLQIDFYWLRNYFPIISGIFSTLLKSDVVDKHNETLDSLSTPVNNWEHQSNASIVSTKQEDFNQRKKHINRPRSISPQKTPLTSLDETFKKSRSK